MYVVVWALVVLEQTGGLEKLKKGVGIDDVLINYVIIAALRMIIKYLLLLTVK